MKVLFATTNQGKLNEAQKIFQEFSIDLFSLHDFPQLINLVVEENGASYEENANLKARAYGDKTKMVTLADDSGLEIPALANKPGVHSHRFLAGKSDLAKNLYLIKKLKNNHQRQARFITVICLYHPQQKKTQCATGILQGEISQEIRGSAGFGYDPIFIPDGYNKTLAELGNQVKNQISHRALALKAIRQFISQTQDQI